MTDHMELAARLDMLARRPEAFSHDEKLSVLGLAAELLRDAHKRIAAEQRVTEKLNAEACVEVERLEGVLNFYADEWDFHMPERRGWPTDKLFNDRGAKARVALEASAAKYATWKKAS